MSEDFMEDKKCRICGLADVKNVNIFNSPNWKNLLTKILTVYPIVAYQNDPLPKNICQKCIGSVSSMYTDVQRVMKLQSKWVSNVRRIQPDHSYVRILDLVENSVSITKESIKSAFGVDIFKLTHFSTPPTTPKDETIMPKMNSCVTMLQKPATTVKSHQTDKATTSTITKLPDKSSTESVQCGYCPVKLQSLHSLAQHQLQHLRLCTPRISEKRQLHKKERRGRLITVHGRKCIRCLNCWRVFDDNAAILNHWLQSECNFYCGICGVSYAQSPKMLREHIIVEHGVSYRSSKLARLSQKTNQTETCQRNETMPEQKQLSISDKSGNSIQFQTTQLNILKKSTVSPTKKNNSAARNSTDSVPCPHCDKCFSNMKARNSHMRKHKPSIAYGDFVLPLNHINNDAYTKGDSSESDTACEEMTSISGVSKSFDECKTPKASKIRAKSFQDMQGNSIKAGQSKSNCLRAQEVTLAQWLPKLTMNTEVKEEPIEDNSL